MKVRGEGEGPQRGGGRAGGRDREPASCGAAWFDSVPAFPNLVSSLFLGKQGSDSLPRLTDLPHLILAEMQALWSLGAVRSHQRVNRRPIWSRQSNSIASALSRNQGQLCTHCLGLHLSDSLALSFLTPSFWGVVAGGFPTPPISA